MTDQTDKLRTLNGELCAEVNAKDARIRELESLLNGGIVRCRDCRAMRVKYGNTGIECWMNGEPFTVEPDGFCAWAERKEVDA